MTEATAGADGPPSFWSDLGLLFIAGDRMPPAAVGCQVIGLTLIVALGGLKKGGTQPLSATVRRASGLQLRSKLLLPLLAIPLITMYGSVALKKYPDWRVFSCSNSGESNTRGAGCGLRRVGPGRVPGYPRHTLIQSVRQSRELTDSIGWTLVLPQMLGMLGMMFVRTGVGDSIAYLATNLHRDRRSMDRRCGLFAGDGRILDDHGGWRGGVSFDGRWHWSAHSDWILPW